MFKMNQLIVGIFLFLSSLFSCQQKGDFQSMNVEDFDTLIQNEDILNMILNLKVSTGKGHVFGIVEDISELETKGIVNMLLYHDANSDAEYYNRRAYISVPLEKYVDAENPDRIIKIKFKYYKYGEDGTGEESDKYCNPGFDYIPELN